MYNRLTRLAFGAICAFLALAGLTSPAPACPFCTMTGETLTDAVNQANMVLLGTLKNARIDPTGNFGEGTTELHVEAVIKDHEFREGRMVVTLPRYLPSNDPKNSLYLIFCEVFKGRLDPYRGYPVKSAADTAAYFKGLLAIKDRPVPERLLFFFDYLDNADLEISNDAYKEFGNSKYADFKSIAGKFPAAKVSKWLQDTDTPSFRYGLYASMLGHSGDAKDAAVLAKMLEGKPRHSGVDGLLAGYTMLAPKAGWARVCSFLADPKCEFMLRYSALKAIRFFWEFRPDLVEAKDMVEATCLLLDQNDIADLAIDDLRKWKRAEVADRVLDLATKPSHDVPIIQRSIMRYALSFPEVPRAAAYVQQMRQKKPTWVKDVEELLKLDSVPAPTASK